MKKFKLLGTLLLASMLTVNTFAIDLNINNKAVTCTQKPVMQDGTTLVPLKVIAENLGAEVKWDKATKTVTVVKGDKTIILTIGSKTAKVNGEALTLAQAPKVINGSTMLPIRFVSEQLDCSVVWNSQTQAVYVTDKGVEAEIPDTTGWKTTTVKNPKVINGKVYLNKAQFEEATGFKVTEKSISKNIYCSEISEDVFQAWFYTTNSDDYVTHINYSKIPDSKNSYNIVREGSTIYYPIQSLSQWIDCSVSYDTQTKTATVIYKGIHYWETTSERYNKINGYVKSLDGKPLEGIVVRAYKDNNINSKPEYATTDETGHYEFEVDTEDWKWMGISVQPTDQTGRYANYGGAFATPLTKECPTFHYTYGSNKNKPNGALVPTNLVIYPDIIAHKND